jgi:hypothetical protein
MRVLQQAVHLPRVVEISEAVTERSGLLRFTASAAAPDPVPTSWTRASRGRSIAVCTSVPVRASVGTRTRRSIMSSSPENDWVPTM